MNDQAGLLFTWRETLFRLLSQKLSNERDPADGEEYNRQLDAQGEAEAYLQAYAALLADRKETLVAERTALAAHDDKEVKFRKTKAALKATAAKEDRPLQLEESVQDALGVDGPEVEVLRAELAQQKKALRTDRSSRALKVLTFAAATSADSQSFSSLLSSN